MPYANPTAAAVSNRERQRRYRARKREAAHLAAQLPPETLPDVLPTDAAGLLAAWCSERLIVPPGHPLAGQPMHLPEYVRGFLADALQPTVKEALLCTARKNSKTGGIAMFLLGLLVGPLRRPGLRVGTISINREKAGELLGQARAIAEAVQVGRSGVYADTGAGADSRTWGQHGGIPERGQIRRPFQRLRLVHRRRTRIDART